MNYMNQNDRSKDVLEGEQKKCSKWYWDKLDLDLLLIALMSPSHSFSTFCITLIFQNKTCIYDPLFHSIETTILYNEHW